MALAPIAPADDALVLRRFWRVESRKGGPPRRAVGQELAGGAIATLVALECGNVERRDEGGAAGVLLLW